MGGGTCKIFLHKPPPLPRGGGRGEVCAGTDCIFKVGLSKRITESIGTEWDEIDRETVEKIDKKSIKKSNS